MTTLATPYDYAADLLALCESAIAETSEGAIGRAYVSPGLPAIDCATIAVTTINLGEAPTAAQSALSTGHRHRLAAVNLLGFAVTLARDCVPVSDGRSARPPLPDDLSAAAAIVTEDVWAVWNAITEAMACGELFGGRCVELFMDGAAALATSGMTAGFVLQLRTAIGGIPRVCEPDPPEASFEDDFTVDGPLAAPYENVWQELTFDPGLDEPEVVGGVLVGADPESAPMLISGVEVDTFIVTIGPSVPTQFLMLLAPPGDLLACHSLTVFPTGANWDIGPTFSQLFVGAFAALSEGDRVRMRVRAGVCSLAVSYGGGAFDPVESAADPLGTSPLSPVIAITGAAGTLAAIVANSL